MNAYNPWQALLLHLSLDHSSAVVQDMLTLVEMGETADNIREFLVKNDSKYWAKETA